MWIWACVAPHPPIVVPEVGRGEEGGAKDTIQAFLDLGKALNPPELPGASFSPCSFCSGKKCSWELRKHTRALFEISEPLRWLLKL